MRKHWIYSSLIGIGLVGSFPLTGHAQRDNRDNDRRENRDDRRDNDRREDRRETRADQRDDNRRDGERWQQRRIKPDELPGEVKAAVGKNMGQNDKIVDASLHTRGERKIYRVEVGSGDRAREFAVDAKGEILGEENTTEEGRQMVKFETLPGEVKTTLSKEAEGRPIKQVAQVTRNSQTYYVARVDAAEGTRTLRVASDGELLVGGPKLMSLRGDTEMRSERGRERDRDGGRADRDSDRDEGWQRREIKPEELPGEVKTAIGGQITDVKNITSATELKRDGQSVYRITVKDNGRDANYRVSADGKILDRGNATEGGRERFEFDRLPGEVKTALLERAARDQYDTVYTVTRGNETWYEVQQKGKDQPVRVGKNGQILTDRDTPGRDRQR